MSTTPKAGALAAFANVFLSLAMFFVAIVLIGPAALADRAAFINMALTNPGPLFLQDILKFLSAIATLILVLALSKHLQNANSALVRTGTGFGILSIALLLANGGLSLYATSQAASLEANTGAQLNLVIGILGIASIAANGIWYLLENWAARKSGLLPAKLTTLGLVTGAISLLPPLAIFVLLLSIIWSIGLGVVLLKHD